MYSQEIINETIELLENIASKNTDDSLESGKSLFSAIFGKRFADDIDKNGVLRYKSLSGPDDNIHYFGILYENASPSGVYENFSLVLFPESPHTTGQSEDAAEQKNNVQSTQQILLCYGIGTGGITDDAEWLSVPWVKRSIELLLKLVKSHSLNVAKTEVFVKDDITDEFTEIPESVKSELGNFSNYTDLWRNYGKYLPSVCVIKPNDNGAIAFLHHLLLYAKFRNWPLLIQYQQVLNNDLFLI